MKKAIDEILEFFVPKDSKIPMEEMNKIRVLINSCFLISALVSLSLFSNYLLTGTYTKPILYAIGVFLLIPFFIRSVRYYNFLTHAFPVLGLMVIPFLIYLRGGMASSPAIWLLGLPIASLYFIGSKKGLFYSMLALTILVFMLNLHITDFNFPPKIYNAQDFNIIMGVNIICLFIFVTYLTWQYEKTTEENASRLKLSQQKAVQANKTKDIFWANISHEIRTPLNGILGMTNLLIDSRLSQEQKEYLKIIRDSAENLNIILSDVIDYSKIETNEIEIQKKPFSLINTLDQVLNVFEHLAQEKNINLSYSIDSDVPNGILTDENRLRQVLVNLVANGIKFTEQGFVKILVERGNRKDILIFSVEDTGIGIPQSKREKLFRPFSQIDESRARQFGGTGLGLVICKKLVELLDGKISVESQVGQGTTFTFSLRVMPIQSFSRSTVTSADNKPAFAARAKSLKILVAEDNPVNRRLLVSLLNKNGFNPDVAENGEEAVNKANENSYELIFMDLQMPVMDGITATKRIIENHPEKRPKIVAVTANVLQEDRDKCFEAGMDDFLAKPINNNLLLSILERYSKQIYGYKQNILEFSDENQTEQPSAIHIKPDETYFSFDVVELLDNYADDLFVIETMVQQFSEKYEEDLKVAQTAIIEGDYPSLELRAHSMKGTFASLFCKKGLTYSIQLERMGKNQDVDDAHSTINELKVLCAELVVELEDFLEKRKEAA